jgi:tetratricopeptide (TPR) repeat protein
MPVFGEFESNDEPLAVTPTRNQTTTVWLARKSGAQDGRQFAVKCLAVHRDERTHGIDEALGTDPGLEFIETVKQLKKAQAEGCRDFAPILAFGTSDAGSWYATEYCARGSLKSWINLRGGMDSAALRQVVSSLADGCKSLKRICGRSHGNLKPSNVLLCGKARPLKSTPLLMVDPMPVSTTRVSELGMDNRMMVQSIFEAQDLRAIGEIILQLVEGRLIESGADYNYPVESSPAWQRLGKDEPRWRGLCNRLIDPQLDLGKTNLEWLAKQCPAGFSAQIILIPAAAAVVVAAGAAIYLFAPSGFQRHYRAADTARNDGDLIVAAQEIQEALKSKPGNAQAVNLSRQILSDLVKAANKEVSVENWNTAEQDINQANTLSPGDPDVSRVDQRLQRGKAYDAAINAGQQAFENKNYDEAIRQANIALMNMPGDKEAEEMLDECATAKNVIEIGKSGERKHFYDLAISAVRSAMAAGSYDEAIRQADTALDYEPGDTEASRLRIEAQEAEQAAKTKAAEAQQAYDRAMQAGRHALENNDYDEAITQANVALENKPGDADASQLKSQAADRKNIANEAQEKRQQYTKALNAGRYALTAGNYDEAINQAQAALAIQPNDTDATKLLSDAQTQKTALAEAAAHRNSYNAAMTAGKSAIASKQYDEALQQAKIALDNEPGDSDAMQLKTDAQAGIEAQVRQRKYNAAIAAAQDALQRGDYKTASAQAKVALENEPGDQTATTIEGEAGNQEAAAKIAAAHKQNYDAAMDAGNAAYAKGQYSEAIGDADTALENQPDDSQADQLKNNAQAQLEKIKAAKEREQRYENAMTAGNTALSAGQYQEALRQANTALRNSRPDDAPATKLQTEATTGLFIADIAAGNADLSKGNFTEAIQYAEAARKLKDDPAAQALETQAESLRKKLAYLDGQLAIMMKYFGVDRQSGSSIVPDARYSKVPTIDDASYRTKCLILTTNLANEYLRGGWLDQEKRQGIIQEIRINLNNY